MTTLSSLRSGIKSIQTGSFTVGSTLSTNTATISSVSTTKSVVLWNGQSTNSNLDSASIQMRVELTNATTVTATRGGTSGNTTVSYTVVEFN